MKAVPIPSRKPRDDDPFRDLFADFEKEFARMQEHMNAVMEQALKNADVAKGKPGNPFVYGFTLRLGPDGRPHLDQFGNTPRVGPGLGLGGTPEVALEGREPITDVLEHEDHTSITVELPGVQKEDVQVWCTADHLTLKVDTPARKYHKEVDLPARVKPDTTEATFKNGVLDVTVKKEKRGPPKEPGHRVNVK